ncbi:MAG: DMT family transporter [Magnetovibrio sp.]|nr:DMT family transporter [Magnetovibrio sp.]
MQHWSDQAKGLFLAIVGVLVITPDALLVRLVSVDEWSLLFWRGLFTGLALTLYMVLRDRRKPQIPFRDMSKRGWLVGILYAINTILFIVSLTHTSVANTLVILSTAPIFAAIMSRAFLHEQVPMRTWVMSIIGVLCIGAIMGEGLGQGSLLGDGAALGMAVMQGAIFTVLRRAGHVDTAPMIAAGGFLMALAVLPLAAPLSLVGLDWLYMVLIGAVILPISFVMITSAPKYIPSAEVSLAFLLETVLGPLWVWLIIDEAPPELTILGGAILMTALMVHTVLALRKRHA